MAGNIGSITVRIRVLDLHTVQELLRVLVEEDMPDDLRVERACEVLADANPYVVEDETDNLNAAREALESIRRAARKPASG